MSTKTIEKSYEPTAQQKANVSAMFDFHKPGESQKERYAELREQAKGFAMTIINLTPKSSDQSSALRLLRQVVWTAQDAIAVNEAGKQGKSEN